MSALANTNTINISITTEHITEDPIEAKGYQQFQALSLLNDTLVFQTNKNGFDIGIATKWTFSKDMKQITFEISNKKKFSNGDIITAEDVLYSFNRHLEKKSPSLIGSYLRTVVEKIETKNNTVIFSLKGPYPPFLQLVSMPGFGIISKLSSSQKIINSGPFILTNSNENMWCLKKNQYYLEYKKSINSFCFYKERDIDKSSKMLKEKKIDIAMGAPLEVVLDPSIDNSYITTPAFSLIVTNIFLNMKNPFFQKQSNRDLIKKIIYETRNITKNFTKFDQPWDHLMPKGLLPSSYYTNKNKDHGIIVKNINKIKLKIIFPYGIFKESLVKEIVKNLEKYGFEVIFKNVKGKELVGPITKGDFDLVFVPYQGVIADADGYLDLFQPDSIMKMAHTPTKLLLSKMENARFNDDLISRGNSYSVALKEFEDKNYVIPFTTNGVPLISSKNIILPKIEMDFHLNLREVDFAK